MTKQAALQRLAKEKAAIDAAQEELGKRQQKFADSCREVYGVVNDREMAEGTGYSRARIQQYRCGDPRKRK